MLSEKLFGLILIFVMMVKIEGSDGACCGPYTTPSVLSHCDNFDPHYAYGLCLDCSYPTPYCGKGPCNIFGCNCECRTKPKGYRTKDDKKFILKKRKLFSLLDENKDYYLTLEEIRSSYPNFTKEDLLRLDKDKNGKLDFIEFSDA